MSGILGVLSGASASGGGGGGTSLDTQVVTVGVATPVGGPNTYGFRASPSLGSIADGTSNVYASAAIKDLYYDEDLDAVLFSVNGLKSNSGWTTMQVGGTSLDRASADSFRAVSGKTTWTFGGFGNLFGGGVGSLVTVTWR